LFSTEIYNYLDNALDFGILERDFWDMTLAEINRAIDSKKRVMEIEAKQQAISDYLLADLIGYSVGRIHNKKNKMPTLEEAYPTLFRTAEDQERIEQNRIEKFKAQLIQFTNSHNNKFKGVKTENE